MNFDKIALRLQPYYSRFKVKDRLLFTGHSYQAWPDCSRDGILECYDDAARLVDEKWGEVFNKIEILKEYLRNWYSDPEGSYSTAASTHDLLIKWISALRLEKGDELVSTEGEFYTIFRQLKALEETGIRITKIASKNPETIAAQLIEKISAKTKGVIISRVFFESGLIFQHLDQVAQHCANLSVPLLIDDYHGTNVRPIQIGNTVFESTYWLIGGYKYLQWGEGNCFLRYPKDCTLKPVYTGWFASFSTLHLPKNDYTVSFDNQMKFAGATFDPSSAYRAAKVVEFFKEQQLTNTYFTNLYRYRVGELIHEFKALDLPENEFSIINDVQPEKRAGFMAIKTKNAVLYQQKLAYCGILTDARGESLRFGPAPYSSSAQIQAVMQQFKQAIKL